MAPVRLPGKGADVTDSDRNDACFYLLVGFDGPLHPYRGTDGLPDTIGYVWTDAPLAGAVGRDPDYDDFMRYIAIGAGAERLGEARTIVRDLEADFRAAFPERAGKPVPDVVRVVTLAVAAGSGDAPRSREPDTTPADGANVLSPDPGEALDRVLAIGHSSGSDLVSGIAGALRALDDSLDPTHEGAARG